MNIEQMKKIMLEELNEPLSDTHIELQLEEKFTEEAELQNNSINDIKNEKCHIKDTLMKNIKNYTAVMPSNGVTSDLVNELTPKIFDNLAAKHFVGIQPMTGPVGILHTLEYMIAEDKPISDEFEGTFAETTNKRISLNIIANTVEAYSRKLETSILIEPMMDFIEQQDNTKKYNPARDIAKEIYIEIRNDITAVAHKHSVIIKDDYTPFDLRVVINYCANEIARKTRRGAGNFIIVSETVADILKDSMEIDPDLIYHNYDYVNYVGTIGVIDVYRDLDIEYNKTIIGYKGKSGETDAGYFYAPYIPLMASVVVNPTTFQPVVSLMTRYGKHINQPTKESVSNDGSTTTTVKEKCNYYYELTFENLPKLEDDEVEKKKSTKVVDVVTKTESTKPAFDVFDSAMDILD